MSVSYTHLADCVRSVRGKQWKQRQVHSKPEVAVSVRPGVYKMPMARMSERAGQSAIVRV